MNYNSLFEDKAACTKLFGEVINFTASNITYTVSDTRTTQPHFTITDCIKFGLEYSYKIEIDITDQNANPLTTLVVFIPKISRGIYLIKNREGEIKLRSPIYNAVRSSPIYYHKGSCYSWGNFSIENLEHGGRLATISFGTTKDKHYLYNYFQSNGIVFRKNKYLLDPNSVAPSKLPKGVILDKLSQYPIITVNDRVVDKMIYLVDCENEIVNNTITPSVISKLY